MVLQNAVSVHSHDGCETSMVGEGIASSAYHTGFMAAKAIMG